VTAGKSARIANVSGLEANLGDFNIAKAHGTSA
jgi:hypothetical protein